MVVRIHKPSKEANSGDDNQGSCEAAVDYLEKENIGKELGDKKFFFDNKGNNVGSSTVISALDNNKQGLRKSDAKFYMLTINPSKDELRHIGDSAAKLREFTKSVMQQYAAGFNRMNASGQPLDSNDLVYFAKREELRRYDARDHTRADIYQSNRTIDLQIKSLTSGSTFNKKKVVVLEKQYVRNSEGTVIRPGAIKDGLNSHVHVLVSRKDVSGKISLSPFANAREAKNTLNGQKVRIGFDREAFIKRCEERFDHKFDYLRSLDQTIRPLKNLSLSPESMAKNLILNQIDNDRVLRNSINNVSSVSNPMGVIVGKATNELVKMLPKTLSFSPIPAQLIRKAITKSISTVIKAAELGL